MWTYIAVGIAVVAYLALTYVLWSVYRGLLKLLKDPDTWKLFDGE